MDGDRTPEKIISMNKDGTIANFGNADLVVVPELDAAEPSEMISVNDGGDRVVEFIGVKTSVLKINGVKSLSNPVKPQAVLEVPEKSSPMIL